MDSLEEDIPGLQQFLDLWLECPGSYIYGAIAPWIPDPKDRSQLIYQAGRVAWSSAGKKTVDGRPIPFRLTRSVLRKKFLNRFEGIGKRLGGETNYSLSDVDIDSPYHFYNDPIAFQRLLEAPEEIGLCRSILVRSSESEGLHIIHPFEKNFKSWKVATELHKAYTKAGFTIKPGWLEIFPNIKVKGSLYNAHRIPLQLGSFLLDNDLQPISNDLQVFVQAWSIAAAGNMFSPEPESTIVAELPDHSRNYISLPCKTEHSTVDEVQPVIDKSTRKRRLPEWTGISQSNDIVMKGLANYGYEILGLTKIPDLAQWIRETAPTLPGYSQFCSPDSKADIETGTWPERWAKARVKRGRGGIKATPSRNLNSQRQEDAISRIQAAVVALSKNTFKTLRSLWKAIQCFCEEMFGIEPSNTTLKKYHSLWEHLLESVEEYVTPSEPEPEQGYTPNQLYNCITLSDVPLPVINDPSSCFPKELSEQVSSFKDQFESVTQTLDANSSSEILLTCEISANRTADYLTSCYDNSSPMERKKVAFQVAPDLSKSCSESVIVDCRPVIPVGKILNHNRDLPESINVSSADLDGALGIANPYSGAGQWKIDRRQEPWIFQKVLHWWTKHRPEMVWKLSQAPPHVITLFSSVPLSRDVKACKAVP